MTEQESLALLKGVKQKMDSMSNDELFLDLCTTESYIWLLKHEYGFSTHQISVMKQKAKKRIKKAKSMTIKWHPYPLEKPKADCGTWFKVKLRSGLVDTSQWRGEEGFEWQFHDDDDVIAWAELPKPCEG